MIPRMQRQKQRLSKTTIASIRALARRGSDLDLEDFIYRVAMKYIAEVRNTDYIEEQDYLCVKDKTFECECPNCHEIMTLELKELVSDD